MHAHLSRMRCRAVGTPVHSLHESKSSLKGCRVMNFDQPPWANLFLCACQYWNWLSQANLVNQKRWVAQKHSPDAWNFRMNRIENRLCSECRSAIICMIHYALFPVFSVCTTKQSFPKTQTVLQFLTLTRRASSKLLSYFIYILAPFQVSKNEDPSLLGFNEEGGMYQKRSSLYCTSVQFTVGSLCCSPSLCPATSDSKKGQMMGNPKHTRATEGSVELVRRSQGNSQFPEQDNAPRHYTFDVFTRFG